MISSLGIWNWLQELLSERHPYPWQLSLLFPISLGSLEERTWLLGRKLDWWPQASSQILTHSFICSGSIHWSMTCCHLTTFQKESYDKPRQCIESKDISFPTKVCIVKAMVFPVVMYGYEELDHKEGWAPKNCCFRIVVLDSQQRSNQSILRKVNPEYSL